MDRRRARTALCTYLLAVGSSRAYAFAPSILHGTPPGGPGARAREPPGMRSPLSGSRAVRRVRGSIRGRNNGLNGTGGGGSSGVGGSTNTGNTNSITPDAGGPDGGGNTAASAGGGGSGGPAVAGQRTPEVGAAGAAGVGIGGGARRPYLAGRSRPAMALGQAMQGRQGGGVAAAAEGGGAGAGEAAAAAAAAGGTKAILATANRTERGQRLRAVNWVKQVRNELTSAEFALNLNGATRGMSTGGGGGGGGGTPPGVNGQSTSPGAPSSSAAPAGAAATPGSKSEIDFETIAERLEASLRALQAGRPLSLLEAISPDELREITARLKVNLTKIKKITQAEGRSRDGTGGDSGGARSAGEAGGEEGSSWRDAGGILGEMTEGINVNLKDVKVPEFDLFVRDDGTVDWDGAIQSGREVARFGQELWDRINGQNPDEEGGLAAGGSHGGGDKNTKEIPEDSAVMLELRAIGEELEGRQEQLRRELDALKAEARAQEATWKTLERRKANRRIRSKQEQLDNATKQIQLHNIDVDMERICYNIEQEIRESTPSSLSEYRLLVAEFGLLDAQLANLTKLVAELTGGETEYGVDGLAVDEDELELVSREVVDLKNRLGLDLESPALAVDPEKVTRYAKETYDKIKSGLDFYWTGTKILGNDVGYALTLVSKAVQGSILNPREVRTLRRTAKDCVTFIPFVIILIVPLTPVGHVLVFSFIQRFFPNFFPSTYTDRRQNLLKMYTEVEKKVDLEDTDRDGGDDILENLRRNFIATLNQAGDQAKKDR